MEIFYQIPNWVDQVGVVVMSIFLMGVMLLSAEIWVWILAEIGIAIYERLRSRVIHLSL